MAAQTSTFALVTQTPKSTVRDFLVNNDLLDGGFGADTYVGDSDFEVNCELN
jgi:hypothetical protein